MPTPILAMTASDPDLTPLSPFARQAQAVTALAQYAQTRLLCERFAHAARGTLLHNLPAHERQAALEQAKREVVRWRMARRLYEAYSLHIDGSVDVPFLAIGIADQGWWYALAALAEKVRHDALSDVEPLTVSEIVAAETRLRRFSSSSVQEGAGGTER